MHKSELYWATEFVGDPNYAVHYPGSCDHNEQWRSRVVDRLVVELGVDEIMDRSRKDICDRLDRVAPEIMSSITDEVDPPNAFWTRNREIVRLRDEIQPNGKK